MKDKLNSLFGELTKNVIGSEGASRLLMMALVAEGHVLIQGAPGLGKTTLCNSLAHSIDCSFSRIQFTPDLLPADIVGYSIFDKKENDFRFIEGPIFNNIVLADEINRTSPRIQSALLEAMNERQVSIDGRSRDLESPFMVIATQNTLYSAGTFPLPEPQLDRFLISIELNHPSADVQTKILQLHASGKGNAKIESVMNSEELKTIQKSVSELPVSEEICKYIVNLCEAVKECDEFRNEVSSRGAISIMKAAKSCAFFNGNSAVFPEDVKEIFIPVLAHRLFLKNRTKSEYQVVRKFLSNILAETRVP
ncbi:MAG: MoxR family ATPase [Lentisphaeraceae bacterium]|nr:MoxR family ATPase [Lentisphaeraceae bacterium]